MIYTIQKSSGEQQRFDLHKFRRSLFKAGASEQTINSIVATIHKENPSSTKKIHELALKLLKQQEPAVADRYNLKHSLMEFGPEGYSFEQYISQILAAMGYEVETNIIMVGACITHEVDIVAKTDAEYGIVECKFHNRRGPKSDVKVALYMQARYEDIRDARKKNPYITEKKSTIWVITNTKFTSEAIKYGTCKNMKLISWDYPEHGSLADLIEKYNLYPITTLTSLNKQQKQKLMAQKIVLCKDVRAQKERLQKMGMSDTEIEQLMKESKAVCKI